MRKIIVVIFLVFFLNPLFSQDIFEGNKIWYSNYLHKKLNQKVYFTNYLLFSFNTNPHSFSFLQNDLAANYTLSKKVSINFAYSYAMYNWTKAYLSAYDQRISYLNTIGFNRISLGGSYEFKFKRFWKLDQDFAAQLYFPQLEKYQYRFEYSMKLSFKESKTQFRITPFIQGSLYYYLNGVPIYYYTDAGDVGDYKSPNGLHRYRTKFGITFRPLKNRRKISMVIYYCMQKEFNIRGIGNDLNVTSPAGGSMNSRNIVYPFNNYNIYGIQLNLFLR